MKVYARVSGLSRLRLRTVYVWTLLWVPRFVPTSRRNGSQEAWDGNFCKVFCGNPTMYAVWFLVINS